jgi:NAD(P)-dependent dehydrogenase (short-subunit alcohol dehydrogenase family)
VHGSGIKRGKAIITGGRRGIGRGIAEHLAAEGVSIATGARRANGLQAATEALKVKGVTGHCQVNRSQPDSTPNILSS